MDCDLYADLEMSNSEGEEANVGTPSSNLDPAGMDLMDEGLTSESTPTDAPQVARPPHVDIEVEKLKHEVSSLKEDKEIIFRNLLLLYKTAHHIIQLKDEELSNLRTKYDAMCFRHREVANLFALPSIAPVAHHRQNADARIPGRSTSARSNCPQLKDQPKRPTMLTEFSLLQRYAQVGRGTKAGFSDAIATASAKSVENGAGLLNEKSLNSEACEMKQGSDANSDRRDAIRRSAPSEGRREDSHGRARHSDRDQYMRGSSRTPRRGSQSRSPVGENCLGEGLSDRKRARGSSEDDHGAKLPRHEKSLRKPQAHEVVRSPQVNRSPMKLKTVATGIPMVAVKVMEDPRPRTEAVRPVLLDAISYSAPTDSPAFDHPVESPNLVTRNPSPQRSPREVQIGKLEESDTALLQSLLEPRPMEPPRSEFPSGSLDYAFWLDDLPCDDSGVPETPGKNLDLSEFENTMRQSPGSSNR